MISFFFGTESHAESAIACTIIVHIELRHWQWAAAWHALAASLAPVSTPTILYLILKRSQRFCGFEQLRRGEANASAAACRDITCTPGWLVSATSRRACRQTRDGAAEGHLLASRSARLVSSELAKCPSGMVWWGARTIHSGGIRHHLRLRVGVGLCAPPLCPAPGCPAPGRRSASACSRDAAGGVTAGLSTPLSGPTARRRPRTAPSRSAAIGGPPRAAPRPAARTRPSPRHSVVWPSGRAIGRPPRGRF